MRKVLLILAILLPTLSIGQTQRWLGYPSEKIMTRNLHLGEDSLSWGNIRIVNDSLQYKKSDSTWVNVGQGGGTGNDTSNVFTGTLSDARSLTSTPDVIVLTDYGTGVFVKNDTVTVDNTGTQIITAGGQGYSRVYDNMVSSEWFGVNPRDSVTDQTSAFTQVLNFVGRSGGGVIFVPSGNYNVGINNTYSNITFYMGGDVRVQQVWHFAVGFGPDIAPADPNYSDTVKFVENVHIIGSIEFTGANGRLGCFYAKNCSADKVRLTGENRGIHIYSHSENIRINEVYATNTANNSSVTGAVFIDQYPSIVESKPKNISIGKIYADSAYFLGVLVNCDGFQSDEIIVNNSGLSGVRITGSTDVNIGYISTINCGNSYSTPNQFLRTGVTIDGGSKRVNIGKIKSKNSYYSELFIKDVTTTDINIGEVDAVSKIDGIYSTVYLLNSQRINIDYMNISGSLENGLELDDVKNATLGYVNTSATKAGMRFVGNSDFINTGHLYAHKCGIRGLQLGGSGNYSFGKITTDSVLNEHIFIISLTGNLKINEIYCNGLNTANFYGGLVFQGITGGTVNIDNAVFKKFKATSNKGIYAVNANGTFNIGNVVNDSVVVGIDINNANCSGFNIGKVTNIGVTTVRTTYPFSTISYFVGAGTSSPSSGTYVRGDMWQNSQPSINTPSHWVCVQNGSPGIWVGVYPSSTSDSLNEKITNKSTSTSLGTSNTLYPTQNAVKTYVDSSITARIPNIKIDCDSVIELTYTTVDTASGVVGSIAIPNGEVWDLQIRGIGVASGAEAAKYLKTCIAGNVGGTASILDGGVVEIVAPMITSGMSDADLMLSASSGNIDVKVRGVEGRTINWKIYISVIKP